MNNNIGNLSELKNQWKSSEKVNDLKLIIVAKSEASEKEFEKLTLEQMGIERYSCTYTNQVYSKLKRIFDALDTILGKNSCLRKEKLGLTKPQINSKSGAQKIKELSVSASNIKSVIDPLKRANKNSFLARSEKNEMLEQAIKVLDIAKEYINGLFNFVAKKFLDNDSRKECIDSIENTIKELEQAI